jgi:hypothetical protein
MPAASQSTASKTQKTEKNQAKVDAFRKMSLQKTATIPSIIAKLKISSNMSEKDIKKLLFRHTLNDQFDRLCSEGKITGSNDVYIMGTQKGTKMQIIRYLMTRYASEIDAKIKNIYDSVKKHYQIIQNKEKKIQNKIAILNIKTQRKAVANTREQLVEDLHKRNQGLIDAVYKQGRLESAMRSQQSKFLFQKDKLGAKFQQIKQNYESQIIKNQNQNIRRDLQIQAIHQYRATNRQHLSMMFQKQREIELNNSDQKDKIELLRKKSDILRKLLEENKAIRNDLNKGTESLIELLRRNGLEVRNITQEQAERLQKALTDAAARLQNANKTAANRINDALNTAAQVLKGTINAAGAAERKAIDDIIDALDKGTQPDKDMADILDKPRPPPNLAPDGMPWNCKSAPCGGSWQLQATNARSRRYPQDGPITIWRCSFGAHFCSSNDEHGDWNGGQGAWGSVRWLFDF